MKLRCWAVLFALACCGCGRSERPRNEAELVVALRKATGVVVLPPGVVELTRELTVPAGFRDLKILGDPAGSTLRLSEKFQGRAALAIAGGSGLTLEGFHIDGRRERLAAPVGLPPSNVSFARFYANNGILAECVEGLDIRNVSLANVANYAVLIGKCARVRIESVTVTDSGSTQPNGRNNASGGILLEEGSVDFEIRNCALRRILGNAIWTHSNYHSPRNARGAIEENLIVETARDAIQIGHATGIKVVANRASRIGYPLERVDLEGYGTPVGLDTAGDVDRTVYRGNYFEDVNGQCIDLDGFHDGEVSENRCVSRRAASEYPFGHYGIVMGNTNPDMRPEKIVLANNFVDGAGYGGVFVVGSGHRVEGNRFVNLNRARCTGDFSRPRCAFARDEPDMLRSGIYLARAAARAAPNAGNVIRDNTVAGFGMGKWCVSAAPGVSLRQNRIERNRCSDE